ncbi:hypothetical protein OXYTRIMIC_624 [Oxytricha trifallax]|uniref:Uncharacterized protein n=1 Tax=Oxytricha trifallax TaxID=1172189 RepID=A0A073HZY2_9SPIT|nr:hypothetical protein OXYTRIMIC_624 [Oxytricha trifallax]
MLNLEVGFTKMEIGKSGYLIREEEANQNQEKRSEIIWNRAGREIGDLQESVNQQIDNWEGIFQRNDWQMELEQEFEHQEKAGREFDGHLTELECCLFSDGSELQQIRDAKKMAAGDLEKEADIYKSLLKLSIVRQSSKMGQRSNYRKMDLERSIEQFQRRTVFTGFYQQQFLDLTKCICLCIIRYYNLPQVIYYYYYQYMKIKLIKDLFSISGNKILKYIQNPMILIYLVNKLDN